MLWNQKNYLFESKNNKKQYLKKYCFFCCIIFEFHYIAINLIPMLFMLEKIKQMYANCKLKKYIFLFLSFFALLFLYNIFYVQTGEEDTKQEIIVVKNKQDWKEEKASKYSDILNEENYERIWINPNDYPKLGDFLKELKTFSGVTIDPVKEDFVVWKDISTWSTMYIPFRQDRINSDDFSWDLKNIAILDIYEWYKNNKLYWWEWSKSWSRIIFEEDLAHSSTTQLTWIFNLSTNVIDLIDEMEKYDSKATNKVELLSYLYDFVWNYDKAGDKRSELCDSPDCKKETNVKFYWTILDQDGNPLSWVKITLLNNDEFFTTSWDDWKYELNFKSFPFSHLRFKASKQWYSDWFTSLSLNTYKDLDWPNAYKLTINLNKNNANYSVDTLDSKYSGLEYYEFSSSQSKYLVPTDWLYLFDGSKWKWTKFDVYLYEFTKWDKIDDLVTVDTFNPVYGYVWNLMKTFWMPYIQFIDSDTWEEIFVNKSNPMILQNNIYHMQELFDNYDKVYEALTKDDMEFLVQKSLELWWYPIDFEFLTTNNFLRWPAWWALDRKKWVWENIGSRVISVEWLVELPFYSINDVD